MRLIACLLASLLLIPIVVSAQQGTPVASMSASSTAKATKPKSEPAEAKSAPAKEPLFNLELVQTVPESARLDDRELLRLLGADEYTPEQRQAILGQVRAFAAPEFVVVMPAHIEEGQKSLGLPLQVYNRTAAFLDVLWDESYYLDGRGNTKLAPKGLRVEHPREEAPSATNTTIHPTRIPPGLFFKGYVFPVKDFDFKSGTIHYTPVAGQIGLYLAFRPEQGKPTGVSLLFKSIPAARAVKDQGAAGSM